MEWLRALIRESLQRAGESGDQVSEENRQRLYLAFNVLHRGAAKMVRYRMTPDAVVRLPTADRQRDSVGVGALRRGEASLFLDDNLLATSDEETRNIVQEILDDDSLPRSAWYKVNNSFNFKTPLNVAVANHRPEREFIRHLVKQENASAIDAWIKSTDRDFYPIEYAWRKGEHLKRGFFNPDFFIKKGDHVIVVEIKGDEELHEPSDENKGKFKAAREHFETLNGRQDEFSYYFHFLTPRDYDIFWSFLREGNYSFVSELDAVLGESGR